MSVSGEDVNVRRLWGGMPAMCLSGHKNYVIQRPSETHHIKNINTLQHIANVAPWNEMLPDILSIRWQGGSSCRKQLDIWESGNDTSRNGILILLWKLYQHFLLSFLRIPPRWQYCSKRDSGYLEMRKKFPHSKDKALVIPESWKRKFLNIYLYLLPEGNFNNRTLIIRFWAFQTQWKRLYPIISNGSGSPQHIYIFPKAWFTVPGRNNQKSMSLHQCLSFRACEPNKTSYRTGMPSFKKFVKVFPCWCDNWFFSHSNSSRAPLYIEAVMSWVIFLKQG